MNEKTFIDVIFMLKIYPFLLCWYYSYELICFSSIIF